MKQPLLFQWSVSTLFGWGVYGLNLLRHWHKVAGTPAYSTGPLYIDSLGGSDPLTLRELAPLLVANDQVIREREELPMGAYSPFDGVVLHSLGRRLLGSKPPNNEGLVGNSTSAVVFFEDTYLPDAQEICKQYDLIIPGSTWGDEVLKANNIPNSRKVIQGIDPSIFHPAPRAGALEGRFAVFSGGKLEHRKGQDLVLLAFRAFAQRHPEALLVTAWHSPWPACSVTVNINPRIAPVMLAEDGTLDINRWAFANGIQEHQWLDLGAIPNHLMAKVLREMDVAIFPNRCEGGTNLVAMECMACGLPCIVANNTGQKDLVATGTTYPLNRQGAVAVADMGTDGWGESDVEEMVESLEKVWANRTMAASKGLTAAQAMREWSWRNQIADLHRVLLEVAP
ncbi:MAG: glycosyltransferase family 4 protein [Magnetococcales bacterium]|nr:glycosyltransferase family 4 protein [Magnetococcales bacterium]